jgi:hypothetical protein
MEAKNIVLERGWFLNIDTDLENIYENECLHESVDNDMISAGEEGFMLGYLGV